MADSKRHAHRDTGTGRFAKVGDSIEHVDNVSGAPSPSTTMRPRHAPGGDGPDNGSAPLPVRRAVLIHPDDAVHAVYGVQGAILRTAARGAGPHDPTPYLVGLETSPGHVSNNGDDDGR